MQKSQAVSSESFQQSDKANFMKFGLIWLMKNLRRISVWFLHRSLIYARSEEFQRSSSEKLIKECTSRGMIGKESTWWAVVTEKPKDFRSSFSMQNTLLTTKPVQTDIFCSYSLSAEHHIAWFWGIRAFKWAYGQTGIAHFDPFDLDDQGLSLGLRIHNGFWHSFNWSVLLVRPVLLFCFSVSELTVISRPVDWPCPSVALTIFALGSLLEALIRLGLSPQTVVVL